MEILDEESDREIWGVAVEVKGAEPRDVLARYVSLHLGNVVKIEMGL